MIRNIFYIFLVCVTMLSIASQGMANPMPCSSLTMSDEAKMDMPDCANMEMKQGQDGDKGSRDCCVGDCATMLQCSQTSATLDDALPPPNTAPLTASHLLITPSEAPRGLSNLPEIKPPIIA